MFIVIVTAIVKLIVMLTTKVTVTATRNRIVRVYYFLVSQVTLVSCSLGPVSLLTPTVPAGNTLIVMSTMTHDGALSY